MPYPYATVMDEGYGPPLPNLAGGPLSSDQWNEIHKRQLAAERQRAPLQQALAAPPRIINNLRVADPQPQAPPPFDPIANIENVAPGAAVNHPGVQVGHGGPLRFQQGDGPPRFMLVMRGGQVQRIQIPGTGDAPQQPPADLPAPQLVNPPRQEFDVNQPRLQFHRELRRQAMENPMTESELKKALGRVALPENKQFRELPVEVPEPENALVRFLRKTLGLVNEGQARAARDNDRLLRAQTEEAARLRAMRRRERDSLWQSPLYSGSYKAR